MGATSSSWRRVLGMFSVAAMLGACSLLFEPADFFDGFDFPWPDATPVRTAERSEIDVVHEDPGTLAIVHGFSCATSDRDGTQDFVRIQETLDFGDLLEADPRWITDATVFLNGFQARFVNEKHELVGVTAAIARIEHERTELRFEGGGALADQDFDAPYELCYSFTALAWNRQEVQLAADHGDPENVFLRLADDNPSVSSLSVLRNYRQDVDLVGADTPVGLLPRGVGMSWESSHQLLQASYSSGTAVALLEGGRSYGPSDQPQGLPEDTVRQGDGGVSWDSTFIFKPNDKVKRVYLAELVSIVGGDSMTFLQPPFQIEPADETETCGGWFTGCIDNPPGTNGPMTVDIVVENLPYDMAIPVLNGWSLGYALDDHTIRDLGIAIDTFSYEPPSGASPGTLRYTLTAVADNGESFVPALRSRVAVLGLRIESDPGPGGSPTRPPAPDPGPVTDG